MSYLTTSDTLVTSDGSTVTASIARIARDAERADTILTVADVRRQDAEEERLGVELDRSDATPADPA